ncbi:MAG TPA: hypothetical protein VEA37_15045 [Flavobacterium sp.]|nr:hypothetical protein [Flavobacterium sp.]
MNNTNIISNINLVAGSFGKGGFINVAQQMRTNNSMLTPLQLFSRPPEDFIQQFLYNLWNKTSFSTILFILIGFTLFGWLLSPQLPRVTEAVNQIITEYNALDRAGYLTNDERFEFFLSYLETGAWVFVVIDVVQKLSYFFMLRAALQAGSLYYVEQYGSAVLAAKKLAPLPLDSVDIITQIGKFSSV